jgi:hypothetical protein
LTSFSWELFSAIAAWGSAILSLVSFLHYRTGLARKELIDKIVEIHEKTLHLDECIDKSNRDITALRLFMAANFTKQEIQDHWEKRDAEVNTMMVNLGRHDSQIAVITSEMAATRNALDRILNKLERLQ